jgi:uncharacterized protein
MTGVRNSDEERVPSPCVGACCLDDEQICLGCFRSHDEIVQWWESGDEGRREILAQAACRRERHRALVKSSSLFY